MVYPYRKDTFLQYLVQQIKTLAEFLFYGWMTLLAPTATIVLGILASSGRENFGAEAILYLWYGFGFCALCTIITIFLLLYDGYKESQKRE